VADHLRLFGKLIKLHPLALVHGGKGTATIRAFDDFSPRRREMLFPPKRNVRLKLQHNAVYNKDIREIVCYFGSDSLFHA
jgi:hypothetical protein